MFKEKKNFERPSESLEDFKTNFKREAKYKEIKDVCLHSVITDCYLKRSEHVLRGVKALLESLQIFILLCSVCPVQIGTSRSCSRKIT